MIWNSRPQTLFHTKCELDNWTSFFIQIRTPKTPPGHYVVIKINQENIWLQQDMLCNVKKWLIFLHAWHRYAAYEWKRSSLYLHIPFVNKWRSIVVGGSLMILVESVHDLEKFQPRCLSTKGHHGWFFQGNLFHTHDEKPHSNIK
jgi:hypothetical protein